MERLDKAFRNARRKNLVPFLILAGILYILYYSIVEYTLVGIIICSMGLLFNLYILIVNIIYNNKLSRLNEEFLEQPESTRQELISLLEKVDKSNARLAKTKGGMVGKAGLGVNFAIEKDNNMLKRNKIAGIIYEMNLYIKNNIK